jgi:hypothetical protein
MDALKRSVRGGSSNDNDAAPKKGGRKTASKTTGRKTARKSAKSAKKSSSRRKAA